MAIEFACPECARGYSVKDELAGKSAKCGQCGHKMKIPAATTIVHAAVSRPPAPKSAAVKSSSVASPVAKAASAKSANGKPAAAGSAAKPAAKAAAPKAPPADPDMSSWLDEELKSSPVAATPKPQLAPSSHNCPSCEAPLADGAVLCVKCGYDTRTRGRRSVVRTDTDDAQPKRSKLGAAASLLRGSVFSFLAAMLGAIIWAVLAYFTMYEFSIVAWGLGGLAGLGMAIGHESDDGTFPGIVAAFMSLLGIVAAKVFIVIIFIAAAVSAAVGEMELTVDADPVEAQRSILALSLAMKDLEASGESIASVDEARFEEAVAKSREVVAELTPEEIEARLNELGKERELEGEVEDVDEDASDSGEDLVVDPEIDAEADSMPDDAGGEEDVTFGAVVGSLFGPMDGLFILLAFFTAYKVGSGEIGD